MLSVSGSTKAPFQALEIVESSGPSPVVEEPRHSAMQRIVERLVGEVVLRHIPGQCVLDLGLGAPEIAEWVEPRAATFTSIHALDLGRGDTIELPLSDHSIDVIYSLRTLPHLGRDQDTSIEAARSALREIGRILVVGGTALLLFDNPRSLWGLSQEIRHLRTVVEQQRLVIETGRGLTRFDTLSDILHMLPPDLAFVRVHGIRITTPWSRLWSIPVMGRWLETFEWWARDQPFFRRFGAHLLVEVRRVSAPTI